MVVQGLSLKKIQFSGVIAVFLLILVACQPGSETWSPPQQRETYLPPSDTAQPVIPTQSTLPGNSSISTEITLPATPTPSCVDSLRFIADLTIPDGTTVRPGEQIDKQWQVGNQGTCNWNSEYRLKLIAGPPLGANSEMALFPARSSSEVVIQIIFTAPAEPGVHRTAWQAINPHNEPFGDPLFMEIIVQEP